jgi:hypothetical protein
VAGGPALRPLVEAGAHQLGHLRLHPLLSQEPHSVTLKVGVRRSPFNGSMASGGSWTTTARRHLVAKVRRPRATPAVRALGPFGRVRGGIRRTIG